MANGHIKIQRANLFGARLDKQLLRFLLSKGAVSEPNFEGSNFEGSNFEELDIPNVNLKRSSLKSANFQGANLQGANLVETDLRRTRLNSVQATNTCFRNSNLTGACIKDWIINKETTFKDVICKYIYRGFDQKTNKFTYRLPVNPAQEFKPGEFEEWIKVSAEAQQTIDLTFTEGIDWQAFFQSLQGVRQKYPDSGVGLQAIEEKGTAFVIRIKTSPEADKSAIESSLNLQYQLGEARGKVTTLRTELDKAHEEKRNLLDQVMETMAKDQTVTQNFYASVGNTAGQNDGQMQATLQTSCNGSDKSNPFMTFLSWFQNGQAIIAIIALAIGAASTYFIPKMFPDGFPPVNTDPQPEAILSAPSSPRTEIGIGKRMAQQVHQFLLTRE